MDKVRSADGTLIAFDRTGSGPALILLGGAFSTRGVAAQLSGLLAPHFTVFAVDRRGRGDSGDTAPYSVDREVDDVAALIHEAGGTAFVYGHSSGAGLALAAAVRGLPIERLGLYEPPFIVDDARTPIPPDFAAELTALVNAGQPGDAVARFWEVGLQMPPDQIAAARDMPWWPGLVALAHTLPYDTAIVGPYQAGKPLPSEWAQAVTIPTLVLDGGESPAYQHNSVAAVAALLPNAERQTLPGQGHGAPAEMLAPILVEFFGR